MSVYDDFEVVWDGSKSRDGSAKSLTSYSGPSSLLNAPTEQTFTGNELYRLQVALGVKSRPPSPSKSEAQSARQMRERNPNSRRNRKAAA